MIHSGKCNFFLKINVVVLIITCIRIMICLFTLLTQIYVIKDYYNATIKTQVKEMVQSASGITYPFSQMPLTYYLQCSDRLTAHIDIVNIIQD